MAEKNRRNTQPAFRLIVTALCVMLIGAGSFYLDQNKKQETLRAHIAQLQSENASLSDSLDQDSETLASLKAEIEELDHAEEKLERAKAEYYETCAQLEEAVVSGNSPHKIAYLTFDDGPYEKTTGKYLDVLKEYDVLATFFQLGKTSDSLDALYHRAYDEGHTIANHTYSHRIRNGIYTSVDAFINDVKKNREFIEDKLGFTTDILRFPGGSSTARSLKDPIVRQLRELGYGYVDWNSATGDGLELLSPQEYRDNVLRKTGNRKLLVVLMHDYSQNTLIALPEIIEGLRAQGYTLLPLFYESSVIQK